MDKNWIKKNKKPVIVISFLLICMMIGWSIYFLFGHPLIKAMYEGRAVGFLNEVISGQSEYSLEFYFKEADRLFLFYWSCIFLSPIFYLFLFKLVKYLLNQSNADNLLQIESGKRYIKNDLLIAAAVYSISALLFFYPCLKSINNSLIAIAGDNMAHFWTLWWGHKAITEPTMSLTFSNYIFYPEGGSLIFHGWSFYNLFLSLILRGFFNLITTYNLLILHTFVLSGIGAFLLIKYLTKDSFFSLIGGFIFAFNPSHFSHSLGHMEIASIQFIPFFVLYFIKTLREGEKKNLFLACLFFFMSSICSWYYMVFAIYFIGFSYVYLMFKRKHIILKDVLMKVGIIIGTTILTLSPWLLKMVVLGLKHPEATYGGHNVYVADIFGFITPHTYHLLADLKLFKNINEIFTGHRSEANVYLGIISLLIVFFTFKKIIKNTAKYFCGFFAFVILAMGSYVHILGRTFPILLPYEIIRYIPFLSNARCPSRIVVYSYLFLAIIITFALKYLFGIFKSRKKRNCLMILLIFFMFFDYYSVSNIVTKAYLPSCYDMIKSENEVFGILDLPMDLPVKLSDVDDATPMMYQTYHGFPIVQGYLARKVGQSLQDRLELKDLEKQKTQLKESNVKYIVIHKRLTYPDLLNTSRLDIQQYKKWYKTRYEDEEQVLLQVY